MKHELNIPRIEQKTTEWCWAACTQMIIGFTTNKKITQEQIVAIMYDVFLNEVSINNPECNQPASELEIKKIFEEYAVSYEFLKNVLSYQQLIKELNTSPVGIGIQRENGGHMIIAYGYNTNGGTQQEVLIRDPWKDYAPIITVDYADLINGKYGSSSRGKWIDTFWKLKSMP
jgi:hypothetical protein